MKFFPYFSAALLTVSLLTSCGAEQTSDGTENGTLQLVSELTGSGGEHKADAPNAVSQWQIFQTDNASYVFQARTQNDELYFDATVQDDGSSWLAVFRAPVSCEIRTDRASGITLKDSCTHEQIGILGVTALDFINDLQNSEMALQISEQKADGIASGACAAAEVVLGGFSGLLTTFAVFHASIIESIGVAMLGGGVTISAAGVGLGALVFGLSTLGTAWAVDKTCDALGVGEAELSTTLAQCVSDCDEDDETCLGSCVSTAATDDGILTGESECVAACDDASDCSTHCANAYSADGNLAQTLLMQCVLGCGDRDDNCANGCVDATNATQPHE